MSADRPAPAQAGRSRPRPFAEGARPVRARGAGRGAHRAPLRADATAALTVFAVLVPSAMAYGELAGASAEAGLYAALAAMLAYALLGTSRQLIVGPEATSALLAATAVAPLAAGGDPARHAALAAALAILVGLLLVVGGLLRIGFLAEFLSRPVLVGYMAGTALIVIASQLGTLFGVRLESDDFFPKLTELLASLALAHPPTLALGLAAIGLLVLLKRWTPRIPGPLVVVVLGTAGAALFELDALGIDVAGELAPGIPAPGLPPVGPGDLWALAPSAATMALLSFADSVLTARAFAARHGYAVDANRELLALGLANVGAGLARGFPISSSGSRTAVCDGAGADSKRVGLLAALLLVPFLLFLTPLLRTLPLVVLAAIVIVSSAGLIDYPEMRRLLAVRRTEYALALLTLVGVLALGILQGILVAVTLSLLDAIARIYRPHDAILGHLESVDAYVSLEGNVGVEADPRLIVYRFDAPLFFANTRYFLERVGALLRRADPPPRCFVLDAQAISSLDSTAVAVLEELLDDLDRRQIRFILARANGPTLDVLAHAGLTDRIGDANLVRTVRAGVRSCTRGDPWAGPALPEHGPAPRRPAARGVAPYPRNPPSGGM